MDAWTFDVRLDATEKSSTKARIFFLLDTIFRVLKGTRVVSIT